MAGGCRRGAHVSDSTPSHFRSSLSKREIRRTYVFFAGPEHRSSGFFKQREHSRPSPSGQLHLIRERRHCRPTFSTFGMARGAPGPTSSHGTLRGIGAASGERERSRARPEPAAYGARVEHMYLEPVGKGYTKMIASPVTASDDRLRMIQIARSTLSLLAP